MQRRTTSFDITMDGVQASGITTGSGAGIKRSLRMHAMSHATRILHQTELLRLFGRPFKMKADRTLKLTPLGGSA